MKIFVKSFILKRTNILWKNRKVISMTILELKNIKKSYFLGKEEFPLKPLYIKKPHITFSNAHTAPLSLDAPL